MCTYCGSFAHNLSVDVTDATTTSTSTGTTSTTKSFWTVDQIADQLTDGYWDATDRTARKFDISDDGTLVVDLTSLTSKGLAAARQALQAWTEASGIKFVEYVPGKGTKVDIQFGDDYSGAYSSAYVSNGTISSAHINIADNFSSGAYFLQTYIHEIGHALGLGHTGNYNGSATFSSQAMFANDTWQYSIMSYFYQTKSPYTDASFLYVTTPQIADVKAIQNLYGVSSEVHAGATVYGDGGDETITSNRAQTIVDASGIDEINLSKRVQNHYLDLNDGTFSNVGGYKGNLAIAEGTMIENATTGNGADTIIGNELDNLIRSGAGQDVVTGAEGMDTIDAGTGNDSIDGGAGDDLLIGGAGNDTILGGAGEDSVQYTGNAADFAFLMGPDGLYVDGAEGLDLLIDVETVVFADTTCKMADIAQIFAGSDGATWMSGADLLTAILELSLPKPVEIVDSEPTEGGTVEGPGSVEPEVPVPLVTPSGQLQVGQLDLSTKDGWIHITFDQAIANAVVVIGAVTENGDTPVIPEVANVTDTGFDLRLTGYTYTSLETSGQSLSWMAGSEGTHYLSDGTKLTFGETRITGETKIAIPVEDYSNDSLVFGSLTGTGTTPMILRLDSDTLDTGFYAKMQAQESLTGKVKSEVRTASWVVMEPVEAGLVTGATGSITDKTTATAADADQALFAAMNTIKGVDTSTLGYTETESGDITIRVIEEQSRDTETTHWAEAYSWANISSGSYAMYGSAEEAAEAAAGFDAGGAETAALEIGTLTLDPAQADDDGWIHVEFSAAIPDAVVVLGPVSSEDGDPVTAEMKNISDTGFDIRLSEFSYQDGVHGAETLSWMAGSAGTHELADGTRLTFGTQTITGERAVNIAYDAGSKPILLAGLEIDSDVPATYRLLDVEEDGARMLLQVEEALKGTQSTLTGTVQWVAIEAGNGDLVSSGTVSATHKATEIAADTSEALFADMQTYNGSDTAVLRFDTDADSFVIAIDEEQSKDLETIDWAEGAAWVGIDEGCYSFVDSTGLDAAMALDAAVYDYL